MGLVFVVPRRDVYLVIVGLLRGLRVMKGRVELSRSLEGCKGGYVRGCRIAGVHQSSQ